MINIILGCLIANLITVFAITYLGWNFYKKEIKPRLEDAKPEIEDAISKIKAGLDKIESIDLGPILKILEDLKKILDKFPFKSVKSNSNK